MVYYTKGEYYREDVSPDLMILKALLFKGQSSCGRNESSVVCGVHEKISSEGYDFFF